MQALRRWLDATKWSQAELARRVGVSSAQISRLLVGERNVSRPLALALEQVTTDAFRSGEVATAPLRSADLLQPDGVREGSR